MIQVVRSCVNHTLRGWVGFPPWEDYQCDRCGRVWMPSWECWVSMQDYAKGWGKIVCRSCAEELREREPGLRGNVLPWPMIWYKQHVFWNKRVTVFVFDELVLPTSYSGPLFIVGNLGATLVREWLAWMESFPAAVEVIRGKLPAQVKPVDDTLYVGMVNQNGGEGVLLWTERVERLEPKP